jgi:hypothetical protein
MSSAPTQHEPTPRRVVTHVSSLDSLVGAHPRALAQIYGAGRSTNAADLGDAPRGRILAFAAGGDVFLVLRPMLRAFATGVFPWQGKTFDHGGCSGQNVVLGRKLARFHAEVGPSALDGQPALRLSYDAEAYKNPWPLRIVEDELRTVGKGIAIGPAFVPVAGKRVPFVWFGLEA